MSPAGGAAISGLANQGGREPLTQGTGTPHSPLWGHVEAEPVVGYSGLRHFLLEMLSFQSAKATPI